jgi:hypothetical protein
MPEFYKGTIPILDESRPMDRDILRPEDGVGYGYVERDYNLYPEEMFDPPSGIELVPASEDDARYDEQEATKSSLEHIYLSGPNGEPAFDALDQDGDGYCWAYSGGSAIMLDRLKQNLKPVRLNPHSAAAIIKKGRNEGGWCGLSAQFYREVGIGEEGTGPGQWPLHSRNIQKYDTAECRASMAKYKVLEDWVDLTRQVYNQTMTERQLATCGFNNIPAPSDFPWWAHSVCQVRWVRIEKGSWGPLILNSWKKSWGRYGLAVLRGSQRTAGGAVAFRMTAS